MKRDSRVPSSSRAATNVPVARTPKKRICARGPQLPLTEKRGSRELQKRGSRSYAVPGPHAVPGPQLPLTEKQAAISVENAAAHPKPPPINRRHREPSPPKTGRESPPRKTETAGRARAIFLAKKEFVAASKGTVRNPHTTKNHICSRKRFTPRKASARLRDRIRILFGIHHYFLSPVRVSPFCFEFSRANFGLPSSSGNFADGFSLRFLIPCLPSGFSWAVAPFSSLPYSPIVRTNPAPAPGNWRESRMGR